MERATEKNEALPTAVAETAPERVRINLSQTAKNLFQFDITAESGCVERSGELMRAAILEIQKIIRENGFTPVS